MKNPFKSMRLFYSETVGELRKATWPTKSELRDATIVVFIAAILIGVFVSSVDFSLYNLLTVITDWVKPLPEVST
jgi:preprotein translocase subunit SecE